MASAVAASAAVAPPSAPWLGPRISFSADADKPDGADPEASGEFEFRLDDPVAMLPADELFSGGKLVPLHFAPTPASQKPDPRPASPPPPDPAPGAGISAAAVASPRAPRCSSRWRDLLGLRRGQNPKPELQQPTKSAGPKPSSSTLKHFLHRSQRSAAASDAISTVPLLRDLDTDPPSPSAGADPEEQPRLSLDAPKPAGPAGRSVRRVRISRQRSAAAGESPRMSASGRVVFTGLERSSSSPGSFAGGPRARARAMERSYSAHVVRVSPVLNVPVCSLRSGPGSVFGLFSSPQKKDRDGGGGGASRSGAKSGRN